MYVDFRKSYTCQWPCTSAIDVGHMFAAGISDSLSSDLGKTFTSFDSGFPSLHGTALEKYDATGSDATDSPNHLLSYPASSESSSRRSRPSFLDSLNVVRPSSGAPFLQPEKYSSASNHLESSIMGTSGSKYFHNSSVETKNMAPFSNSTSTSLQSQFDHSSNSTSYGQDILSESAKENSKEKKHDLYAPTQNEDFAALEQVLPTSNVQGCLFNALEIELSGNTFLVPEILGYFEVSNY